MNFKRISRLVVALVLACTLTINFMIPPRAQAASLVLGSAPVGQAVSASLVAAGIGVGATAAAFDNLVSNISGTLESDTVPVWVETIGDIVKTYLPRTFVFQALAYCYDSGAIHSSIDFLPAQYQPVYDEALNKFRSSFSYEPYVCISRMDNSSWPYRIYFGPYPFSYDSDSGRIVCLNGSERADFKMYMVNSGGYSTTDPWLIDEAWVGLEETFFYSGSGLSTSEDLTLGAVGTSLDAPVYDAWNGASVDMGDTAQLPVSFGETEGSTITGQTQEQAQSGVTAGSIASGFVDSGSTTPSEGLEGTFTETISGTFLGALIEFFDPWFSKFWDFCVDLGYLITGLAAALQAFCQDMSRSLSDLFSGELTFFELLAEVLSTVLSKVFAPSETFIATKVETLLAKYPYLETFLALGTSLKSYFQNLGSTPPVIYINLGNATGTINWGGGEQPFLDLRWYAAYKPTVDAILGAFIWLWLAWRVFLNLPGIINGTSGVAGTAVRMHENSLSTEAKLDAARQDYINKNYSGGKRI